MPQAHFVRVAAGDYWLALSFDGINHNFICDQLDGAPLAREHGTPWRIVLAGGACFTSVKWVSSLELTADAGAATAERIARGRLTQLDSAPTRVVDPVE